jgi:UDP-2,3-diacylglucosamine pyrophosphatase LpxH
MSEEIPFNDSSKIVLFSDCHRGDNSWADDFAHNQSLFYFALEHYYEQGFTCIEIGDSDELHENKRFEDIRRAHSHVFFLMRDFYRDGRLYLIFGNHDIERKDPKVVERTLYRYYDEQTKRYEPLFDGIEVHEGIVLRHWDTAKRIFLAHGHQGDLLGETLWWAARFVSRHFWRHLQLLGIRDPTSPAKNNKKRRIIEGEYIRWVTSQDLIFISGHTHRPMFPQPGTPPYFNTGSCVHPRSITGIEIENGEITLVMWLIKPKLEEGGMLYVTREIIAGPEKLSSFFLKRD